MRSDLNKLMCERERFGSSWGFRDNRHAKLFNDMSGDEYENLSTRESMKERYKVTWQEKEFGENLNPLYGFVRKCVNKPWDKSYSELCTVFDMSSVINKHILQHLFDMVELKTFVGDDGEIMFRGNYRSAAEPVKSDRGPEYYVHPTTGILLKNKHYKSYKHRNAAVSAAHGREEAKVRKIISDKLELRRKTEQDPWFLCEMAPIPQFDFIKKLDATGKEIVEKQEAYRFDMWEKANVNYRGDLKYSFRIRSERKNYYNKNYVYVAKIRSPSHKELKAYKVI